MTFGLSIPIIALYSYIPVTKVEPISKFYKDLPPQHKIKYKTEFNKKITAKKASGIQNGMLGSAVLFFGFNVISWGLAFLRIRIDILKTN